MAQPTWVTGTGSLGTIPEGKFYRVPLEAYDPDFPTDTDKIKYVKVSGNLPNGIQISTSGVIEGTPVSFVQGVPSPVSKNVTSKFSIRVYTEKNVNGTLFVDKLNDRTFTITVTGQDIPEFVTPSGNLGSYFDGQLVNKQIEFNDQDPDDTVTVDLVSGNLPPGVSVNSTGLIHGYIKPLTDVNSAIAGWENEEWDSQPLQFNTGTISKNYEFTLRISDGVEFNLRTFSIFVGITTADSTAYTVDTDIISADTITRAPFIANYTQELGSFKHNNFFSHQFNGRDYNNDILNYSYTGSLPSGLSLDTDTGFLYGTLNDVGLVDETHNFTIKVYKKENVLSSNSFNFSIKILGDVNTGVTWNTDSNLGTITNGAISHLSVSAVAESSITLLYRIKQGNGYSKLPQGLALTSTGNIIGRVVYQTFRLFDHNITSDSDTQVNTNLTTVDTAGVNEITFDGNTTTFDKKFTFTIEAYSANNQVSTFKTFNVTVDNKIKVPVQELEINALLSQEDRLLVDALITDNNIFDSSLMYRLDDPYFGVTKDVSYTHAYGLSPECVKNYVSSLERNHYNKNITLGSIKTARALNSDGSVKYEVIYSDIIDNINGVSSVVDSEYGLVYPNSLDNMRNEVIHKVGQHSSDLPEWMVSKQTNGTILGFTPAWVIAYTLPGQSKTITYNINKIYGTQLNKINFNADRYTLKAQFTKNWDLVDQKWLPTVETTFDVYNHGTSASSTEVNTDSNTITCDLVNPKTTETTFDNRSCRFIGVRANTADITTKTADTILITADNGIKDSKTSYKITGEYDEYLMFPMRDIINTKQI